MSIEVAPTILAVVPAKGFSRGKSRLGTVLADAARTHFARELFRHVVTTLAASPGISGVLVLTDDDEVASITRNSGLEVLRDPAGAGLHDIVDAGLARAGALGAGAALVCMADLPHLSCEDVADVTQALTTADLVIAPDLERAGTNVLCVTDPARFRSRFGRVDSFAQHCIYAAERGLHVSVCERPGLCFDVDGPDDLARLDPTLHR